MAQQALLALDNFTSTSALSLARQGQVCYQALGSCYRSRHTLRYTYASAPIQDFCSIDRKDLVPSALHETHLQMSLEPEQAAPPGLSTGYQRGWHAGQVQQGPSLEKRLGKLANGAANLFPLWLVIGATSAMVHPPSLAWFKRDYITKGLALTMLAMGTTLSPQASILIDAKHPIIVRAGSHHPMSVACSLLACKTEHRVESGVLSCRTLWRL